MTAICGLLLAQNDRNGRDILASFQLAELFGVGWLDQPIEFRYDGGRPPATTQMIGPNGAAVPFQWVTSCSDPEAAKGCILIRSGLPAYARYTWTLQSGTPSSVAPENRVTITRVGPNWEIRNGLAGIRIATAEANRAPWNHAPIEGILLPGGTWTGVGGTPNFLYSEQDDGCIGCALRTPMRSVTGYNVTVTDSGPLKAVLTATYTFRRPRYFSGQKVINTAGSGHYTIAVTMYANSKSILIDEDSDMQFSYYLPVYNEFQPDQARLRAHDSTGIKGVSDPGCGYEEPARVRNIVSGNPVVVDTGTRLPNGQPVLVEGVSGTAGANGTFFARSSGYPPGQFGLYLDAALTRPISDTSAYVSGGIVKPGYRGQNISPAVDGYLDLTYSVDRPASYYCSPGGQSPAYRKLVSGYPAAAQSAPWFIELYRSGGGSDAPIVGIYTGRSSQQRYSATGPSMPGIYSSNKHWITGRKDSGIQVDNLLRGADGSTAALVHRNWGIWVSTKADLRAPGVHQVIADDQNSLTAINLSRLYTYQLVYPDPPGGWKWLYLSPNGANRLISLVRNGTSVCGSVDCYYTLLKNSEGSIWGTALLNMWRGNSAAAVQAALDTGIQLARKIETALAAGDNRFDGPLHYYQLGLNTSPETAVLNAIIMDANSTPAQKAVAKSALALFGSLFWDNDWFPIENPSGEGRGLANQVQQYLQYRTQAVAAAPSQPFLASKLSSALANPVNDFNTYFSPTGAGAGSTHYQSAFFQPLILNYLSLSHDGALTMSDPKWAAYAKWELSIQTPPEPRFGNLRKSYSNGDGNTEGDPRTGMLAAALYPVNPTLAGNLMWAWRQSNSARVVTEDAQFVTTLAVIDPLIPIVNPRLSSINFPGYHSVERYNFGTPNETVLWFINGGFYAPGGHRHYDDGQVSIYAHSAPLAIDWNANLYYPSTSGRFMHDSIVFDGELHHPWSADNPALEDPGVLLGNPANTEFAAFGDSTTSTGTFTAQDSTVWARTVRMINFNASYPIIYVSDSFSGPGAASGKTLTWNMMATGPVATSLGTINPVTRFSKGCQTPAGELPSNGGVFNLPTGLSRFNFTGANWQQHATRGIDWDLFMLATTSTQKFLIGNWGHGCQDSREASEYQIANGSSFAEIQDILRVHDAGPFTTIILPYRKTETPVRTVSQQSCGVQIVQGDETSCFNKSMATYESGRRRIVIVYDDSAQSAFGVALSGGPQEVVIRGDRVTWTIGGIKAGPRNLGLPGSWTPEPSVPRVGDSFTYSYAGGAQADPVTITLSKNP